MKNTDRIESFIDFLCSSVRYGTFTESARTDPLHLSHDTWRTDEDTPLKVLKKRHSLITIENSFGR